MNIADLRGIEPENACAACDATGYKYYPTTATWHGGAGGMAITRGICDKCWGSGDKTYTWCNLRDIANRIDEKD